MQRTITPFDPSEHHIYTQLVVAHPKTGTKHNFLAIIDTGAPATEFVDSVLIHAGFMEEHDKEIKINKGMQSQKYSKITFPIIEICGQVIQNFTAYGELTFGMSSPRKRGSRKADKQMDSCLRRNDRCPNELICFNENSV